MADEVQAERRRRWPRALAALALALALMIGLIWLERRPIATGFVDRELARRGVPARYRIETVGLRRQRLEDVVLGDPADPDLVADWVEVETHVGLSGAFVTGVRAGSVRVRGRLANGVVSFGAVDRLLGPSTGGAFALPALDARLADVRLRLETPHGVIGAKLAGAGRIDRGFAGTLAVVADALDLAGCRLSAARVVFAVRTAAGRPTLRGPVEFDRAVCAVGESADVAGVLDLTLGAAFDRWTGKLRLARGRAQASGVVLRGLSGDVGFDGAAAGTSGQVALRAAALAMDQRGARDVRLTGKYRAGGAAAAFDGRIAAARAAAAPADLRRIASLGIAADGTPLAPLARRMAVALIGAGKGAGVQADVSARLVGARGDVRLSDVRLAAPGGLIARLAGDGVRYRWPAGALTAGGIATLAGGGLPDARLAVRQTPSGGVTGALTMAPWSADGAALALTPVSFRIDGDGNARVVTRASVSGPLAGGRVEGLAMPIDLRWRRGLALNPGCTRVRWQRLRIATLTLAPADMTLCAPGEALVTYRDRLGGGAVVAAPRLTGRIGDSPLMLAARRARFGLADLGFALDAVDARLGADAAATRIQAATLAGTVARGGAAGTFAGAGGRIGAVPLALSDAAGAWRFTDGALTLDGALRVADTAASARFTPLEGKGVALTLKDGAIRATGVLAAPKDGSKVADVAIEHVLASGTGTAALIVPGLGFTPKGLQPSDLTPLALGVIAAVEGRVTGRGDIAWGPNGVTSAGRFRTEGTNLAAAFGPVTGVTGEIVFTDLLGLVSAPDQVATVATVNPGIPVENGTIRYRLVGDNRAQVDGGRWPFAGGTLILEPTLLDFNGEAERRMTFRVEGADAGAFLQQFDFENLNASGIFDGVLPMIFDARGGRIENGVLTARGGGSVAYVGAITQEDVGFWGNLAFQALKAIEYRQLGVTMNGPLAGEMVTAIRFSGVSQGKGTKSNFVIRRLAKLPFVFNVTVRAPFRQLLDSVQSFYDPKRLIERNLPSLIEEQKRAAAPPIQPSESEKRP